MKMLALLSCCALAWAADAPLSVPFAEFDKMVAQLSSSNAIGEPSRAGEATVIPFAAIQFSAGSAGALNLFGGGMGGKVVPLGLLIVEGDDVRIETIPQPQAKSTSLIREVVQAFLDRKIVFMGNGLNIGNAAGATQDLAPLIASLTGQTTIMGNALNLGTLKPPALSIAELQKLWDAKKYREALVMVEALLAKEPKNSDLQQWKARIQTSLKKR